MNDETHMRSALAMARRGLGTTWPNPSVGCVVVKDGRVVGRAVTSPGGRPHAEPQALAMAGRGAAGATVYVTLEPCSHHGRTPPCAEALIEAGVSRVVVAAADPDPRVDGDGIARLRQAGIEVVVGVLSDQANHIQAGFMSRIQRGRPLVTLKLASTLDGRIATHTGESRWITGEAARREAHALRGRHDGILVGVGTVLIDDPQLTCRLENFRALPLIRIVVDSHLRSPLTANLIATAHDTPTWILARDGCDALRHHAFGDLGVRVMSVKSSAAGVDLAAGLAALGEAGLTRLLVEGGAQIAGSLLRADLVDRIVWFHAPGVMGSDGWPATQAFGVAALSAMPRFKPLATRPVGNDVMTELQRV
jgi:diaminohydroxyphosphoribosylaminopyrimidine deaminase/5-amino-6-(5-phosphoribosylamino)uracil reductase